MLPAPPIPLWLMDQTGIRGLDEFTAKEYAKAASISLAAAAKRLNREVELGTLSARMGVNIGSSVKFYKEVKA
jgi:hypothetical protein